MEKKGKLDQFFFSQWMVGVDRKETSFTGFDPLNSQLNTFYNSRLAVGKILPPVDRKRGFC